jgi:hypothetical protein
MSAAPASRGAKITLAALLLTNALLSAAAAHRAGALQRAWAGWEVRRALRASADGEALVRPTASPPKNLPHHDDVRCRIDP